MCDLSVDTSHYRDKSLIFFSYQINAFIELIVLGQESFYPLYTGHKLNTRKTFRRRPR